MAIESHNLGVVERTRRWLADVVVVAQPGDRWYRWRIRESL